MATEEIYDGDKFQGDIAQYAWGKSLSDDPHKFAETVVNIPAIKDAIAALRNLVAAAEKMSLANSPHDVVDEVLAAVTAAKEVLK